MGLETILIGSAVLGAGGSVAGGLIGKGGASDAAAAQLEGQRIASEALRDTTTQQIEAQKEAAQKAEAFLREQQGIARADLAPIREAQASAISGLQALAQPGSQLENQQRQVATEAIQRQLAAQGLLRSKNQVDLLSNLELGLAGQRQNILSGLAGLNGLGASASLAEGLGQGLANNQLGLGQSIASSFGNLGSGLANLAIQGGQTRGNLFQNQAQANAGMLSGVLNSLQGLGSNLVGLRQQQAAQAFQNDLLSSLRSGR